MHKTVAKLLNLHEVKVELPEFVSYTHETVKIIAGWTKTSKRKDICIKT